MSAFASQTVLTVTHWTDTLFSFTTTRDPALRFANEAVQKPESRRTQRTFDRPDSIPSPPPEISAQFRH